MNDPYSGPFVRGGSVDLDDGQYTEAMLEEWAQYYMAPAIHPNAAVVGRQVTLPSGARLDLLFAYADRGELTLTVVEMKAVEGDVDAILQCLGYVEELRGVGWSNVGVDGVVAAPWFSNNAHRLAGEMDSMGLMTVMPYLTCRCDRMWGGWDDERRPPDASNKVRRTELAETGSRYKGDGKARKMREVVDPLLNTALRRAKYEKKRRALVPLHLTPETVAGRNGDHG